MSDRTTIGLIVALLKIIRKSDGGACVNMAELSLLEEADKMIFHSEESCQWCGGKGTVTDGAMCPACHGSCLRGSREAIAEEEAFLERVRQMVDTARFIQREARRMNGGLRPPGMELMGWLKDAAEEMSSVLGVVWRVGDAALLNDPVPVEHITIDQIVDKIHRPVEVFVNPYILCLVVVDSDGKWYALQSTAISRYWDDFVKAMGSYKREKT